MSDQRSGGIAWTDETWNPIRGCSRVNASCIHCYAEGVAIRFSKPGLAYEGLVRLSTKPGQGDRAIGWNGVVRMVPEHLADPLRWKRPRRIFVNSMSDLFHEALSNDQIAAVFGVMAAAPRHTFQVLTKRPKRMREWFAWVSTFAMEQRGIVAAPCNAESVMRAAFTAIETASGEPVARKMLTPGWDAMKAIQKGHDYASLWPLHNVHLGVSVGNQAEADDFIPELLDTPAAVRWVSYEPAHGPVDFHLPPARNVVMGFVHPNYAAKTGIKVGDTVQIRSALHWIVVGGESGKGARPFDLAWARSTVAECKAAGVPAFVKQLGAHPIDGTQQDVVGPDGSVHYTREAGHPLLAEAAQRLGYSIVPHRLRFKDRAGADPWEWPRDLWVQEFPR